MNWLNKIKERFKKPVIEKPKEGFKLIYTDSKGNKYYTLSNPANLHTSRALPAWVFSKDSEYTLSREKFRQAFQRINEAVNKKDLASIAKVVGVMEAGMDLYAEPEILLNLATCYVFLNDETNDSYKDYIQEQKRELWKADKDAQSFFLQFAVQYTVNYSELQKLNVLDYLEKAKPVIDQINYHIQSKTSQKKS